jgi:hypothetical protein
MGFKAWARKQVHRQDPVGDFCRDWLADSEAPKVLSEVDIAERLAELDIPDRRVLFAAGVAWTEYEDSHD